MNTDPYLACRDMEKRYPLIYVGGDLTLNETVVAIARDEGYAMDVLKSPAGPVTKLSRPLAGEEDADAVS